MDKYISVKSFKGETKEDIGRKVHRFLTDNKITEYYILNYRELGEEVARVHYNINKGVKS